MRRPDQAVASHVGAAQGQCICGNLARQLARRPRSVSVLRASRFLGSQQLCNKSHNGTCRLSMRNRAFHFEVCPPDQQTDVELSYLQGLEGSRTCHLEGFQACTVCLAAKLMLVLSCLGCSQPATC